MMEKAIKKMLKDVPEKDHAKVLKAMRSLDADLIMSDPSILEQLKKDPSLLSKYADETAYIDEETEQVTE